MVTNQKTFRVDGRQSRKTFVFTNSSNVKVYSRTDQMWDDKINWQRLKDRLYQDHKGSVAEAEEITTQLNALLDASLDEDASLNSEEKKLIQDLFGVRLDGIGFQYRMHPGEAFEKRFASLMNYLFTNEKGRQLGRQSYMTGREGATIKGFYLDISTGQKVTNSNLAEVLKQEIEKTVANDLSGITGELVSTIQDGPEWKSRILVRQVSRQGKVDISTDSLGIKINSQLSAPMEFLADRLTNRTYSLKNYLEESIEKRGVSLGSSSKFRFLSSTYQYATEDDNFADVCTFIYSSLNSKNKTTQRYISWARFIYELTGAGQQSIETKNGRLVDYLVILQRTGKVNIKVIDSMSLLDGMPERDPANSGNFLFSGGHLREA